LGYGYKNPCRLWSVPSQMRIGQEILMIGGPQGVLQYS
jgi:hypothetical protein